MKNIQKNVNNERKNKMLYYIVMTQEWRGEVEAENEDDALEIADMYFSQQEVDESVVVLKED